MFAITRVRYSPALSLALHTPDVYNAHMKSAPYQRVNISLPQKTLQRIDRIAKRGNRSRVIDTAVNFYLSQQIREQIEESIKAGAIKHRKRDLRIAEEMLDLGDLWD